MKYYPYTLQFTHFLCTRQWFLVFSESFQPSPQSIWKISIALKSTPAPVSCPWTLPPCPAHFLLHRGVTLGAPSSLPCALLAPPRGHSVLRPALSSSDATQRLSGSTGADRSATALPRLRHSRAAWGILGPRPARRSSLMGEFRLHLKLLTYKQYNC